MNCEFGEGLEGTEIKGMENVLCIDEKSSYYEEIKGYYCSVEIRKEELFGYVVLEMLGWKVSLMLSFLFF